MKKLFTLFAAAVMALAANAQTYNFTDNLAVTVEGLDPSNTPNTKIIVEEVAGSDGLYNITLKDFTYIMPIGDINLANVKGNSDSDGNVWFETANSTLQIPIIGAADVTLNEGDGSVMKDGKLMLSMSITASAFGSPMNITAEYGLYKYNEKNHQEAIPYLEKVNSAEASQFAEESLVMLSEIYYETGDLEKAMSAYRSLRDMASMEDRKILAETGIMRCAEKLNDSKTVVEAANALLQHSKVDPQLAIEAHYLSAIAYMDMGDKDSAMKEWKTISGDTRNVYGAEAKYRVAELYFNAGNDSEAEKEIMDYIEKGTPHAYWMARSFILQSDIYMKQGKNIDARQFLLSLKQNYNEKDDIASMIDVRLEKLKNNQ